MFLLRKILIAFVMPTSLCAWFLISGLLVLFLTRRAMLGKILISFGIIIFILMSMPFLSDKLLQPLESKYPALHFPVGPIIQGNSRKSPRWIVVLAGGYNVDRDIPLSSRHVEATLFRLVEGIYIHKKLPNTKLLLSSGKDGGEGMRKLSIALGVEKKAIVVEKLSRNTQEQAIYIQKITKKDPFIMVTSASHMPRAMEIFRKIGMDPIPAPSDHWANRYYMNPVFRYTPSAKAIYKTNQAIYEYMGHIWGKLQGHIE